MYWEPAHSCSQLQVRLQMQPIKTGLLCETGDKPFEFLHSNSCVLRILNSKQGSFCRSIPYSLPQLLIYAAKKLLEGHYIFNTLPVTRQKSPIVLTKEPYQ